MPDSLSSQTADEARSPARRRFAQLDVRRATARPAGRAYTRFVGALKLLLPGAALLLVIMIGLWQDLFGDASMGVLEQVDGSEVGDRLLSPRFVGADSRDRPFTLEADYADQLSDGAAVVTFSEPRGELLIEDGFIDLEARSGTFDRQAEQLMLEGEVGLRRSDGTLFNTEQLHVDLKEEHAWSDLPVDGSGSFGTVEAEGGIDITQGGDTVIFKGPARLVLNPDSGGGLP